MVKIRYRGNHLDDPELEGIKKEVKLIKKRFKKFSCLHHENSSIVHLRYVKQNPVLESYVKACCYEFDVYLKEKLHQLRSA